MVRQKQKNIDPEGGLQRRKGRVLFLLPIEILNWTIPIIQYCICTKRRRKGVGKKIDN